MTRDEVLAAIRAERERQEDEGYADELAPLEWAAVISEESGELAQAILDFHRGRRDLYGVPLRQAMMTEAIQTAAACVAFVENWS